MRGLLLNLVAKIAEQDDCSDEVWELFLALERARRLGKPRLPQAHDDDDELYELPSIGEPAQPLSRCSMRSTSPFADDDWNDIPGAPIGSTHQEPRAAVPTSGPPSAPADADDGSDGHKRPNSTRGGNR